MLNPIIDQSAYCSPSNENKSSCDRALNSAIALTIKMHTQMGRGKSTLLTPDQYIRSLFHQSFVNTQDKKQIRKLWNYLIKNSNKLAGSLGYAMRFLSNTQLANLNLKIVQLDKDNQLKSGIPVYGRTKMNFEVTSIHDMIHEENDWADFGSSEDPTDNSKEDLAFLIVDSFNKTESILNSLYLFIIGISQHSEFQFINSWLEAAKWLKNQDVLEGSKLTKHFVKVQNKKIILDEGFLRLHLHMQSELAAHDFLNELGDYGNPNLGMIAKSFSNSILEDEAKKFFETTGLLKKMFQTKDLFEIAQYVRDEMNRDIYTFDVFHKK